MPLTDMCDHQVYPRTALLQCAACDNYFVQAGKRYMGSSKVGGKCRPSLLPEGKLK